MHFVIQHTHTHTIHINCYTFRHRGVIFRALLQQAGCRGQLKCDGTRAETRFRLSAKRTSPFKSAGGGRQFSRLLAAEVCASAIAMLVTPCSEVVWRVLNSPVCISVSNSGYTMFRGGVKSTGYPLRSPASLSLPLHCVTVCHHISTGVYTFVAITPCRNM